MPLPSRIQISSLQIDLPVALSPVVNGYWQVWPDKAGFGEGSSPPGEIGNTVIFAHAQKGLFAPLKRAQIGQTITLTAGLRHHNYTISEIKTVLPSDLEVIKQTAYPILTLYTCSGFLDQKRLIVVATPSN